MKLYCCLLKTKKTWAVMFVQETRGPQTTLTCQTCRITSKYSAFILLIYHENDDFLFFLDFCKWVSDLLVHLATLLGLQSIKKPCIFHLLALHVLL